MEEVHSVAISSIGKEIQTRAETSLWQQSSQVYKNLVFVYTDR